MYDTRKVIKMLKKLLVLLYCAFGGGVPSRWFSIYTLNGNCKICKLLFFKFKLWNLSEPDYKTNKVYKVKRNGEKRLVTNKKELKKYLKNVKGKNNTFILPDNGMVNVACVIGDNNNVEINRQEINTKLIINIEGLGNRLFVDKGVTIGGVVIFLHGMYKKILIGKGCMISTDVNIRTTDGHSIYNLDTGERINEDKDVIIGDKVWIGRGATIHKGAEIPDGCVIGACSFVTKKFEEKNCIIAGMPAKVIKRNICWKP